MMIRWHQIKLFSSGPHGRECIFNLLLLLLLREYLPVLTSLQRRAEPLWSWYGTVALRGCRLGLLHPRGAAPLLPDIPHSAPPAELRLWKHTHRLCFSCSSRRSLQLCTALAFFVPTFSSSTVMIHNSDRASCRAPSFLLWCSPLFFVASQLTFGLEKSRDELSELCSSTHMILLNHALSFMLQDTSGEYASLLVSLDRKVTTQQLSSSLMQLSRVVYHSKVGRFGWLLQNTTEHLLVIASICRETPPKT